jgi:hypothetical protein
VVKKCSRCQVTKQLSLFHKDKRNKDGHDTVCNECHSMKTKQYQKKNPEKLVTKSKKWDTKNVEKRKNARYKRVYGISVTEYGNRLNKQDHCCALCRTHKDKFRYALSVDHCHKTGKIRGLLCGTCNMTIGYLGDDVESFERIIRYLKGELNEESKENNTFSSETKS